MDWLTFFSTSIKSLAWPTAAIIALFVFKGQITELVRALGSRLLTAKGVGVELTFAQRVDQIEESLPAPESKEITAPAHTEQLGNIFELSQLPPPYIVSQAWLRLESAVQKMVAAHLGEEENRYNVRTPIPANMLRQMHIFDEEELSALNELRGLRNRAVHSLEPNITITDALRYNDIANSVIQKIERRLQKAG